MNLELLIRNVDTFSYLQVVFAQNCDVQTIADEVSEYRISKSLLLERLKRKRDEYFRKKKGKSGFKIQEFNIDQRPKQETDLSKDWAEKEIF